jgi:hypothetical protein
MFGMGIEGCREPRDEKARLAQILTKSKGIGKVTYARDRGDGESGLGDTQNEVEQGGVRHLGQHKRA